MGMNALDALLEPGPFGMVGWKVIQSSAALIVSNMPGFMPPLKVTPFIEGGHPDALLGVGLGAGVQPARGLGKGPTTKNWLDVLDCVEAEEALTASAVVTLVAMAAVLLDTEVGDVLSAVVDAVDKVLLELAATALLLLDAEVDEESSTVIDVVDKVLYELDAPVPFPGHGTWPRCTWRTHRADTARANRKRCSK